MYQAFCTMGGTAGHQMTSGHFHLVMDSADSISALVEPTSQIQSRALNKKPKVSGALGRERQRSK